MNCLIVKKLFGSYENVRFTFVNVGTISACVVFTLNHIVRIDASLHSCNDTEIQTKGKMGKYSKGFSGK